MKKPEGERSSHKITVYNSFAQSTWIFDSPLVPPGVVNTQEGISLPLSSCVTTCGPETTAAGATEGLAFDAADWNIFNVDFGALFEAALG